MKITALITKVGDKVNTVQYKLLGDSPPMTHFYPNKDLIASLPFDTEVMMLTISDGPFALGEVAFAFPPIPFSTAFDSLVRYQHSVERRGKEKRARNTLALPVTLAYVRRAALDADFVAAQGPIYFGLSPSGDVRSGE